MGEREAEVYTPVVKRVKLVQSTKRVKGRVYTQHVITIPKPFGEMAKRKGIKSVIITTDDMFVGIPPEVILEKSEEDLIADIRAMIGWLKRHTTS